MKKIAGLLVVIGIVFLSIGAYQYIQIYLGEKEALAEAEELLAKSVDVVTDVNKSYDQEVDFNPEVGDTIGLIEIESIDASIPVIEGTEPEPLKRGVGHMPQTAFPGENDQILLSGHRDTVFRELGDVEIGDIITVRLPYGTFEYEMVDSIIVGADDTTVVGSTAPDEELVISTCYPFSYVGPAPDRYVIYAVPVDK